MSGTNRRLHLNRERSMIAGVCAGYADYFDIDPFFVRLAFVIAVFTWPLVILFYIISYFCMSEKRPSLGEIGDNLSNSRMGRHFKNIDYRKRLYKSTRNKRIAGVCAGLADYFETSPFFIRLLALLSLAFGPFAIFAYVAAAVIMDKNPDEQSYYDDPPPYMSRRERRRYRRHERWRRRYENVAGFESSSSREYRHAEAEPPPQPFDKRDMKDCANKFADLEKKLRRLEATITSKKFKLHSELKRMST